MPSGGAVRGAAASLVFAQSRTVTATAEPQADDVPDDVADDAGQPQEDQS
jgi:hypothetical protein